ncbi:MAG: hypothetical protein AWU54_401, partial [Candidatus Frackibacter sp. T328-2]
SEKEVKITGKAVRAEFDLEPK